MQTKTINVRLVRDTGLIIVPFVQYESGWQLKCIIKDLTINEGAVARIYVRKPSGLIVYNEGAVDTSDNSVVVPVTSQTLAEAGRAYCQVQIYEEDKMISTFTMVFNVQKSLAGTGDSESESDIFKAAAEFAAEEAAKQVNAALGNRVTTLNDVDVACGTVVEQTGIPVYVDKVETYPEWGLTEKGWYLFARIAAKEGNFVTDATTVEGAEKYILTVGADYVDVAVKFDVAAQTKKVVVNWGAETDTFYFKATDLAVRNLDYRVTFYVYDIDKYATWEYAFTTDAKFVADKAYYTEAEGVYTLAEVAADEAVPAYYTETENVYTQAAGVFEEGVTYYTKNGTTYTAATVTVGEAIPAFYNHSKVIFEGMARNVTYRCNTTIDCPMEFILPEIEDDCHGCWFEIRCRHAGEYSMILTPPSSDVRIATEHTQKETAGMNMINLHYTVVDGIKLWRFMNTHSTIPTA